MRQRGSASRDLAERTYIRTYVRTYVREYTGSINSSSTRDVENGVVYRKLKKTELKRKVACCLLHSLSRSVEYLVSLLN